MLEYLQAWIQGMTGFNEGYGNLKWLKERNGECERGCCQEVLFENSGVIFTRTEDQKVYTGPDGLALWADSTGKWLISPSPRSAHGEWNHFSQKCRKSLELSDF